MASGPGVERRSGALEMTTAFAGAYLARPRGADPVHHGTSASAEAWPGQCDPGPDALLLAAKDAIDQPVRGAQDTEPPRAVSSTHSSVAPARLSSVGHSSGHVPRNGGTLPAWQ